MKKTLPLMVFLALAFMFSITACSDEKTSSGFIAVSEEKLTWEQAKSFCELKGGRLPLIDGQESFPGLDRRDVKYVEGFGAPEGKMPDGLPQTYYWAATEDSRREGSAWYIDGRGGRFTINTCPKHVDDYRAACVPK